MYKVVLVMVVMLCVVSCKKKCSERIFPVEVCAKNDTTLAYQLLVGNWYLSRDYRIQPGPGSMYRDRDDGYNCYARGPEPAIEVLPNRTINFRSGDSVITHYYSLTIDTPWHSSHKEIMICYDGDSLGREIGICDNLLSFHSSTGWSFSGRTYSKE